ncbi:hypothetical protein [Acetobacter conturbans]|uniref:Phage protein n=1 Tax=Acetobacter conturbans TaxID=1737472 RepID=A0ABX0K0J6_9PROT|nr:hypothetical protein [Acetobacter conturbans]NHN89111.1 hypothetical protein [Acetobacter conturbans]
MAIDAFGQDQIDQLPAMRWGLLGPEQLAGSRRTRTLGLGAAVRKFNQLAVPGLGGVWFAKQLFLATLGVRIADRLRFISTNVKAIEIANAVEALACWCAFRSNGWTSDSRLRGSQKLAGTDDLTFSRLRQPRFYVTQPMRMATVEALVDLGFVEPGSQRFNSFRCTQAGMDLIEAATAGHRPYNATVEDYLLGRAKDGAVIRDTDNLQNALSPLIVLPPDARALVRDKLCEGAGQNPEAARRKNALGWVRSLDVNRPAGWEAKPAILDANHWDDLRLGARFFAARDAAIDVLNAIEAQMAPLAAPKLAADAAYTLSPVQMRLGTLREAAQRFLDEDKDPTEGRMATIFCRECTEGDSAAIIRNLVRRDDRVLRLVGNDVLPGGAFSRQPEAEISDDEGEGPDADNAGRVPVPAGISSRVRNLYLLDLDLEGRLADFLNPPAAEEAA